MRNLVTAIFLAMVLAACAAKGPPPLGSCMANVDIAKAFEGDDKATYANTVMVGGVSPDGQVNCYWSQLGEDGKTASSTAWMTCERENKSRCTLLADHGHVYLKNAVSAEIAPAYELFGAFAQEFTVKHRGGAAGPAEGTLRCSSQMLDGAAGTPMFVCR